MGIWKEFDKIKNELELFYAEGLYDEKAQARVTRPPVRKVEVALTSWAPLGPDGGLHKYFRVSTNYKAVSHTFK